MNETRKEVIKKVIEDIKKRCDKEEMTYKETKEMVSELRIWLTEEMKQIEQIPILKLREFV